MELAQLGLMANRYTDTNDSEITRTSDHGLSAESDTSCLRQSREEVA